MNIIAMLGFVLGIALLLVAIPTIDGAREQIVAVASSPIAYIFGAFLALTVITIVVATVRAISRS